MYDTIFIEDRRRPTVTLVNRYFGNDARSAASSRGMPGIRVVLEPVVSECSVREEIEAGVETVMAEIVAALTAPLTAEEKSPKARDSEALPRITFKGSLKEINRFFYQRGWTDGLPIVPPTEDEVAEMLTGTDLPPDHVVAELAPRMGKATVEKIAVNAVMAGCLPTYMPLLIAGVHALKTCMRADIWAVSTGAWTPFWVVNGPVRNNLRINNSFGALSPGDIANAAIGRAMGLITKNIRGVRKGIEDMGILGNPGKYSMVVAENEEDSPWEPLHVERGFKKEDSTITLSFPNCYQQLCCYGTDDEGTLSTIIYNVPPGMFGMITLMVAPPVARALAARGWTKRDIKAFVVENARTPLDHHPMYWPNSRPARDRRQPWNPSASVPIVRVNELTPDPIQIFVAGGMGSWIGLITGNNTITEKAELPANWARLVEKYKTVVPTYVRY